MNKAITAIILSLCITGAISPVRSQSPDGYALYRQACEHHDSLGLNSNSPVMEELLEFLDTGEPPSSELLALIRQEQKAFSLIAEAHNAQHWQMPDITTFTTATRLPYISSWREINRVAATKAALLCLDDRPQDALSFLDPFNATGLKVVEAGILLHALVHLQCRYTKYPILASCIDGLPEACLAGELDHAKERYAELPTVAEFIAGENQHNIHTARKLFADLREQHDLKTSREKMIQDLRMGGLDDQSLERIETGNALSISQWEAQVVSDVKRLQSFLTKALSTRPSAELAKFDDEVAEKIDELGVGLTYEVVMSTWSLYTTSRAAGAFSMPEAERLHAQVGRAMSHEFLSMVMAGYGGLGIRYREFIASERLLLVRLALRLYMHSRGQSPSSLQQLVDDNLLTPAMITDPLSGRTFLTKRGKPLEVYSVGRDLDDDDGIPWSVRTRSGDTVLVPLSEKWQRERQARQVQRLR